MRNALVSAGLAAMLVVGCREVPERCADRSPCTDAHTICVVVDGGGACDCAPGFAMASWNACIPAFDRLEIDGRSYLSEVPNNDATFVVVDLPAAVTHFTVEAASRVATVTINGVVTPEIVVPFHAPLTVVPLTLVVSPAEQRQLELWVRRAPAYGVVGRLGTTSEANETGAVALAADAPLVVTGSSAFLRDLGSVSVVAIGDGGLSSSPLIAATRQCPGWTVSASADGTQVATSDCGHHGARFFAAGGSAWSEEPVSRPDSTVDAVALAPRGSIAWTAGEKLVAYERDGGSWSPRLVMTGDGGIAVATTEDGTLAAWGHPFEGSVDIVQLDGRTVTTVRAPAELGRNAFFGASVALSGDGTVLAASTPTPEAPVAFLFEQIDGGMRSVLRVEGPRGKSLPPSLTTLAVPTPVALSVDGRTAAFGFPLDEAVVVAARTDGGWAVEDVLFSGDTSGGMGLFGLGVSLSRDGRLVAVASPTGPGLVVFRRDR